VPGAALGVLRSGEVETVCYGVAYIRTQRPVTASTPFSLGSLTKPLVATLLVRLAEAGELSLDDTLADRIPETAGTTWAEQVTLRDLMSNRSGLPMTLDLEFGFDRRTDADRRPREIRGGDRRARSVPPDLVLHERRLVPPRPSRRGGQRYDVREGRA
jgi:CubicO group peptidase (beta-lactamase class C family)